MRTLSRQSKRGLLVLGRLFSGVIHCCSVAIPSACSCICCKLFWCLPYNMGVRSGVCTAFALLLLTMLVLHCSACMVTTSESFAVFCHLLLAGFVDRVGPLALRQALQVAWWRQTLQFRNCLAVLPVGSLYYTVCLDSLADAFQGGACNVASSLAACLHSMGLRCLACMMWCPC